MGTVRERQPGVWEVRVYVGRDPVSNAPRQVSRIIRAGPRTKTGRPPKAVTDLEHELEVEAEEGKLTGAGKTGSVSLLLDRYVEHLDHRGLSAKTLHNYRRYIENTLRPALGHKLVRKVTAWDLDSLYTAMSADGKAPATVRLVHAIISGALGQAVKWGWVAINVAKTASPPTVRAARVVAPTPAQVQALVRAAEERDPVLSALIMLAALTGARRGELCALRWTDVDLAGGALRISRSILDIPGRVEEKGTKTHQERTIALGDAGIALLQLHRRGIDQRARTGETFIPADAFVFSDRFDCATPIRPDRVTRFFTQLRDDLGLRAIHLHSLRHFTATQLAARGDVSVRTLAGRLGHADASVSLRVYSQFFPAADGEAADHLGRALAPKASG
jgi:integrase